MLQTEVTFFVRTLNLQSAAIPVLSVGQLTQANERAVAELLALDHAHQVAIKQLIVKCLSMKKEPVYSHPSY